MSSEAAEQTSDSTEIWLLEVRSWRSSKLEENSAHLDHDNLYAQKDL